MKLWEQFQNRRLRLQLAEAFTWEVRAATKPIDQGDSDRIWRGIDGRLAFGRQRSRTRPRLLQGAGLAMAVVCAVLLLHRPVVPEAAFGVKGNAMAWPTLSGLRFAVVDGTRGVTPGWSGMELKAGAQMIFAVEGSGISAEAPLATELGYRHRGKSTLISSYTLTNNKETLHSGHEVLAFTLESTGDYEFFLRPRRDDGDQHDAGFTVRVVAP